MSEFKKKLLPDSFFDLIPAWSSEFAPVKTIFSTVESNDLENPGEPLLLKGAINHWPAIRKWTFQYFLEKYGTLEVVANLYSGQDRIKIKLNRLIDQILSNSDNAPYLQEWWYELDYPELLDDIIIPQYFLDDFSNKFLDFKNSHLWIGGKSSSTPFHQDETAGHVWSAQICGIKHWIFINPDTRVLDSDLVDFSVKKFNNKFNGAIKYAEVLPGDILFLPSNWWHSVHSSEPTITLRNVYVPQTLAKQYFQGLFKLSLTLALKRDYELQNNPHLRYQLETFCEKLDLILRKTN
jgi:hypothetical protein